MNTRLSREQTQKPLKVTDVTRDDSQRRFLAQHSVAKIVANSYNTVPTLQPCVALKLVESSRATSP